jgi:hypothetical protein
MASFKDRISAFFNPPVPTQNTATDMTPNGSGGAQSSMSIYERLKSDRDRLSTIKTCRTMYKTDTRVQKALRMYANDVVKAGFIVKTDNAEAKQIAEELSSRIGMNKKMQDVVRLSGRDGDSFYEVVIDEQLNITEVSRKPTLRMRRNSSSSDKFTDMQRAYYMVNDLWMGTEIPKDALFFANWQMIHTRWDHDEESRYGTPMWASATGAFKKVTEGELDLSVRRKVRAGMRFHHVVEGSPSDVEAYKTLNKDALNNPTAAQLDFFTNKPGSITAVQGDAHLNEINDILHHVATMFAASDVPMELVAYGEGLNRDILGEKKEEYEETLDDGREWVTDEFIKPLFERQWLLHGLLPASISYKIIWRKAKAMTPADIRDLADGMARLRLLGVKEEVIQLLLAMFLRDVDQELLTNDGIDSERFATMLQGISI